MKTKGKGFVVLGLGSFGMSLARELAELGCEVVAVDQDKDKVREIADEVSYAMCADIGEPGVLESLGGRNLDGALVATAENLEASIMATISAKEAGIPFVMAKARNRVHESVLDKVGADYVVYPERDMGKRVARILLSNSFKDWIELSPKFSMVETDIPKSWVGKTLLELNLRERYHINVVAVIYADGMTDVILDAKRTLPADSKVVMVGANEDLEHFKDV